MTDVDSQDVRAPEIMVSGASRTISFQPLQYWRKAGILIPLVALFAYLAISVPSFLTTLNVTNLLDQQAAVLCIAAAGTLVLVSGGIDLSVGSTYALSGVAAGMFGAHHGAVAAIVLGIVIGLAIGIVNGLVVTMLRITPFVATLAMSYIVYGIALKISSANLILTSTIPGFQAFANTVWWKLPVAVWIAIAFAIAMALLLSRTTFGRYVVASGGNAEAARLAGVRVSTIRIAAFALSGLAAGLGGVLDAARLGSVQADSGGVSLAFLVLTAIVVGGTSIAGGDGSGWRTIGGVLFIALIGNGFDLKGIDPNWQPIVLGIVLIAAVGVDMFTRRARR
jgi:ribose transport system permease protein